MPGRHPNSGIRQKNDYMMKYIYVLFLLAALCSCRSVEYIPVETVRTDTLYSYQLHRDSIYRRDSIYIRDKGDTVWMEKYRYLYRDKLIRDTLYLSRTDSIRVPYPVEKPLTRWQQWKIELGGFAMAAILALLAFGIFRLVRKLRK